ncbi:MAG: acyl carrier protein phosphodiesterase [Bacteroidales bacterium]|jgi:acyl carrier protein phosphodiesterase|nr:acyl carrier protein phosphodiesterase [Bacteroidales bacterium]MBR6277938.1 acyl carrier protein phosphodiesterase [Bacteroidales bacterium]
MNYLAHIYLAGEKPLVKIGNFIGDWIKGTVGSFSSKFPPDIVKGILMHRFIDSFTDTNSIVQRSIMRMRPWFGLYSGVVIDVIYDYYLAKNWKRYSQIPLENFCNSFYSLCVKNIDYFPSSAKETVPHLILTDRLKSYETLDGIKAALRTMSFKTSLPCYGDKAIEIVIKNYDAFDSEFTQFFELIRQEINERFFSLR